MLRKHQLTPGISFVSWTVKASPRPFVLVQELVVGASGLVQTSRFPALPVIPAWPLDAL